MKKEANGKKSKLGLIIAIIAAVVVLAVAGVLLIPNLIGGGNSGDETPAAPEKIESKLYWNIDRATMVNAETGLSQREPAADGLYYIRFAVDGEQVELPCADRKVVNMVDFYQIMGLQFDADGIIVGVYEASEFTTVIADNNYVQRVDGNKIVVNSAMTLNGMETEIDLSNANVYIVEDPRPEVPGRDFTIGAKDEVKLMDTVLVYGSDENSPHTVYITDRLYDSKVYWRVSAQEYNSTTKMSSRLPDDEGYWYMDFLCEGEVVTVRTKDQACINAMDGYNIIACGCGLVFDKNGDVVDVFNAGLAAKGRVAANNYDVTAIDGNTVTLTRKLNGTELGRTYTLNMSDDVLVYNVNTTADKFGELTDIRMGDRLYVLADATGKPVQVYVTCRLVDSPMYYNVSVSYNSTTKETGRKPNEDGYYTITLAVKGKQKDFRCKSKAIMTQIDAYGNRVFGLKVRGDLIVKAYNPECVTGAYSFAANNWVTSESSGIVGTVSDKGVATNGIMADNCEVYDVSGCSEFMGAKTTLRVGDRIVAYNTPDATMRYIYITSRKVSGVSLYWNFEKKYNAATGLTTRTPDADGYYVFKMAKCGSAGEKLMKTKDIEIASKIDKTGVYALCLKAKGDIIQSVYPATAINAGYSRIFGIYTTKQDDDTHYGAMFYTTGATASIDISLAKIYNVSGVYKKGAGEKTTLQPNDRLMLLYGASGKAEHILVFERECGSNAYWQFNPNYNAQARTTEPDADGYYNYTVTSQGKIKNVKTKDKDLAAYMDGRFLAFGLKLDGDIIKGAYSAVSTKEIAASAQSFYDVAKIKGNKITLERTVPGSSNTGDIQEIDISKAKVYNVSAYAGDAWGKTAKLGIGDRVQTYMNEQNEITLVYIVWENTREAGHKSYCEHCKQTVVWHPYYGTIDFIDKHYYLPADFQTYYSKGWGIQGRASGWDWVLDLNGFTYEATGSYAFAVRGNSKLTVVDTSKAKTGRITGVGVQIKDAEGNKSPYQSSAPGIFQVLDNGTLNLRGGTYTRTVNREITNLRRAGVAIVEKTGTLNIYDGAKLINNAMDVPLDLATDGVTEVRRAPQGGALYNNGGTINIHGGQIANNGKIHADFKEFEDTAVGNGGNIFNASGELNIYGGKISGGWSRGNGGNIYVNGGKLTIAGGEISGATSINGANNIIVAADKNVEVNITGGKVTGDFTISTGNTLKISGKPVISMGEKQGLFLGEGVKAQVGTMKDGAKIVLSSTGVFTTDFATKEAAEAILAKNYFVGESSLTPFYVEGKALACGKQACMNGHTTKEQCDAANCDKELLKWNPWTDTDSLPTSGNYYLTQNVTVDARVAMSGNLNLDLNGKDITRVIKAGAADFGVYTTNAKGNLHITDLSGGAVGTVSTVFDTGVTTCTGTGFLGYVGSGFTMTIDNGIFDFRSVKTTSAVATGCGPIVADGNVVINGGTFYGTTASSGCGALFSGRSASTLTVNGGTFVGGVANWGGVLFSTGKIVVNGGTLIGGSATRGGLIYTKDLEITGGLFDGNNNGADGKVNANYPASVVGAHAGLIRANGKITISGGTFQNGYAKNAAGILWAEGAASEVTITGGTFQNGKSGTTGGLMRLDGTATITGATLKGGSAGTVGSAIAFCSNKTLTIGKDAVIEGGVETRQYTGETDTKIVLKDNVQILADSNGKGVLLVDTTLDISGLNDQAKVAVNHTDATKAFAVAADEATAQTLVNNKIIVSGDPNYKVYNDGANLMVKAQIQWQEWNAAADPNFQTKLPTSGSWKLTSNVTVDARVAMTGNLNLNLNGFTVTRVIKSGAADYGVYTTNAKGNLYITDEIKDTDPDAQIGTMTAVFDTGVTTCAGTGFLGYVGAGYTITIDEGIFDYRNIKTTASATTGAGAIIVDGTLTINGGTFYGANCGSTGYGTVIGGRSAGVITINDGTFYGNNAKQGGIISTTGNLTINGGLFDGNTNASNGKVNTALPQSVATHGGLFYVAKALTITGGEFKAGRVSGSGGIAYVTGSGSVVSGGTYTAGGQTNYAGFFRFDGSATISGVTLSGGKATTNGNNIAFGSNGNATLTIGQDAVIDGGIMFRNDKTGNKLVLVGNAQVNGGTGAAYSLNLANATVHIGSASNAAVATVGATFTNYIATYDGSNNVTGVQAQ